MRGTARRSSRSVPAVTVQSNSLFLAGKSPPKGATTTETTGLEQAQDTKCSGPKTCSGMSCRSSLGRR
eukprot:15475731-Alexandrium_andersonii.AAC.1